MTPLILLFMFASCQFGSYEFLTVEFPSFPADFPLSEEPRRWTLEWSDPDGDSGCEEVLYGGSGACSIKVRKESPVICLLHPSGFGEEFQPHPAGGLFVPGEEPVVSLSWLDGAGADFLMRAHRGGMDLSIFNTRRFLQDIRDKEVNDPWLLDWTLLERKLTRQEMKSWYLREQHRFDLEIPLPEGVWFSRALFLPPLRQRSEGIRLLSLPEGDHYFYDPRQKKGFALSVDDQGEFFRVFY